MITKIEIKKLIRRGDYTIIGELSGYSPDYVKKVFDEKDRRYNEEIVRKGTEYLLKRKELERNLQKTSKTLENN